ncbi:hypothetical protein G647_05961 [Cladophialophora carrionii CBS 160.54]|uniref:ATP-grasp domain-containing protein n=1 Tax=Cladophialophora carrionii CBS 160.54 TaxID=1279043 RepID=V9D5H9_9EURO|nr:uncharacterized protein G647_05961 [Cladophialophora carrionii CBS 160.54]ETI21891.1 hypothetical protein G647_05961 [Cladophialophora carrionii CBS 160.54]
MNKQELQAHLTEILAESPRVLVEQFLSGTEGTVTVMPPSIDVPHYWSLPLVLRFNHDRGIAPYNGVVAVVKNSKALAREQTAANPTYTAICRHCERVGEKLKTTAPIRIDVRQFGQGEDFDTFAIFDVNMKPNMTGPGRPGRESQASLTAMAASSIGWDYTALLKYMLASSRTLQDLRSLEV